MGSNVTLLKKLGYARERNGVVYLWPDRAAEKRLPPLVLRLVVVSTGRHPVYLVTSVMNSRVFSDEQVAAVYRRRWGIEVYYRHCKQTFERRKLRSQNPDNAMVELHWSLLGMWAMGLHSHHAFGAARGCRRGGSVLPACGGRIVGRCANTRAVPTRANDSPKCSTEPIIDPYQRKNKTSRDYPRKKQEQAAGPPTILTATRAQVRQAKR